MNNEVNNNKFINRLTDKIVSESTIFMFGAGASLNYKYYGVKELTRRILINYLKYLKESYDDNILDEEIKDLYQTLFNEYDSQYIFTEKDKAREDIDKLIKILKFPLNDNSTEDFEKIIDEFIDEEEKFKKDDNKKSFKDKECFVINKFDNILDEIAAVRLSDKNMYKKEYHHVCDAINFIKDYKGINNINKIIQKLQDSNKIKYLPAVVDELKNYENDLSYDLGFVSQYIYDKLYYSGRKIDKDKTDNKSTEMSQTLENKKIFYEKTFDINDKSEIWKQRWKINNLKPIPYILIGRLAKEGLLNEIVTTNYDDLIEEGCKIVGMIEYKEEDKKISNWDWIEWYSSISNKKNYYKVKANNLFKIYKIHGCINQVKADIEKNKDEFINFIVTHKDLLNWRKDNWARDFMLDRLRNSNFVLVGFSVQDVVLRNTILEVFDEIEEFKNSCKWKSNPDCKEEDCEDFLQRIQAIDVNKKNTLRLVLREGNCDKNFGKNDMYFLDNSKNKSYKEYFEKAFKEIYRNSIIKLIEKEILEVEIEQNLPLRMEYKNNSELKKSISKYINDEKLSDKVIYHTVPRLLHISWLLDYSLHIRYKTGLSDIKRYLHINYYVPYKAYREKVLHILNILNSLEGIYNNQGKGRKITYGEDGWIHVYNENIQYSILPIVTYKKIKNNPMLLNMYNSSFNEKKLKRSKQLIILNIVILNRADDENFLDENGKLKKLQSEELRLSRKLKCKICYIPESITLYFTNDVIKQIKDVKLHEKFN